LSSSDKSSTPASAWSRKSNTTATASTPYPDANNAIALLLAEVRQVLGAKLLGCCLFGSLVTGDYDPGVSDIDLLAVLSSEIDEAEYVALRDMHQDFARTHPRWDNHIEVAYLSAEALRTFRTQASAIGITSPGEPFHRKEAGIDWLINWYLVREANVALLGPPPATFIAPIAKAEYLAAVYELAHNWPEWIEEPRSLKGLSYGILSMCRAAYALATGEHPSKKQAAAWAVQQWPQWAALIGQALDWRAAPDPELDNPTALLPQARQFVVFALSECERMRGTSPT
jgi:hypothetical protein